MGGPVAGRVIRGVQIGTPMLLGQQAPSLRAMQSRKTTSAATPTKPVKCEYCTPHAAIVRKHKSLTFLSTHVRAATKTLAQTKSSEVTYTFEHPKR
jgi:hypothetical protein